MLHSPTRLPLTLSPRGSPRPLASPPRQVKAEIMEIVAFLRNPAKFLSLGARSPAGVLLVGPPGKLAAGVRGWAGWVGGWWRCGHTLCLAAGWPPCWLPQVGAGAEFQFPGCSWQCAERTNASPVVVTMPAASAPSALPNRHRQDAAGQGDCWRGGRALLLHWWVAAGSVSGGCHPLSARPGGATPPAPCTAQHVNQPRASPCLAPCSRHRVHGNVCGSGRQPCARHVPASPQEREELLSPPLQLPPLPPPLPQVRRRTTALTMAPRHAGPGQPQPPPSSLPPPLPLPPLQPPPMLPLPPRQAPSPAAAAAAAAVAAACPCCHGSCCCLR